jgi:hypothetical protein
MTPERPAGRPLRVGLMLDSTTVPAWIAKIIRQLGQAPFTEVAYVVLNSEPATPQPRLARLRTPRRQHLLFNLYRRVDERLFSTEPNAFAAVELADELAGVPAIAVTPLHPRPFEHRFEAEAIEQIRAADLDVLLRFGFNIIRGEILDCARYGVWSYHHGDNFEYRGGPDFFWEIYEGNPVSGTLLQVLTDDLDAGGVLCRSFSATDPTSLHRGRSPAYWKSAEFVLRRLTDVYERGWEYPESSDEYRQTVPYAKSIYRTPGNAQMLIFLGRLLAGLARRQVHKLLFEDAWFAAYRRLHDDDGMLLEATTARRGPRWKRFRPLASPPDRYYADPFVVEHEGVHLVFLEDYRFATGRGVISVTRLDVRGAPCQPTPVLERPYHLSYPFVMHSDGDWYMLPETGERRTVELYRATDFPDRWTLVRVILDDVDAVDPTILAHDGRFWLFTNIAVPGGSTEEELFLFFADSLLGKWTPHPRNPIVSDVRRARPAGRIFVQGGELIRPSQDSSRRYGGAIVFNRITQLSTTGYAEQEIARLERGWRTGNLATHTYNRAGAYEVLDAQRRTLRAVYRLRERLRR